MAAMYAIPFVSLPDKDNVNFGTACGLRAAYAATLLNNVTAALPLMVRTNGSTVATFNATPGHYYITQIVAT